MAIGRPRKCSETITDYVVAHVLAGGSLRLAFDGAGISQKSGFTWLANPETPEEEKFSQRIKTARAETEQALVNEMRRCKNPTPALFTLKCQYHWQETERIEHAGVSESPLVINFKVRHDDSDGS